MRQYPIYLVVAFTALASACASDGEESRPPIPGLDLAQEVVLVAVPPESGLGLYAFDTAFRVGELPPVNVGRPTARFLAEANRSSDPSQFVCLGSQGSYGCELDDPGEAVISGLNFGGPEVQAWAWLYLPEETAAVRFIDAEGGISWQRPARSLVIFPAPEQCDCRMEAVDSDGDVLVEATLDL